MYFGLLFLVIIILQFIIVFQPFVYKKKYNLRSKKSESIHLPLQLHLSDDNDFVTNLLGHKNSTMSHQDSDSSLSGSVIIRYSIF